MKKLREKLRLLDCALHGTVEQINNNKSVFNSKLEAGAGLLHDEIQKYREDIKGLVNFLEKDRYKESPITSDDFEELNKILLFVIEGLDKGCADISNCSSLREAFPSTIAFIELNRLYLDRVIKTTRLTSNRAQQSEENDNPPANA